MYMPYLVNIGAAVAALIIGFIYYHPMLLGKAWMKYSGVPEEKLKSGNMAIISLGALICLYFIAKSLGAIVIHQHGLFGMLANQPDVHTPGTELYNTVHGLMDKYGQNYRTFKHGALHGFFTGLYFALPLLGVITLFERRPWQWLAIHAGYWIITLLVMGGIVCQFMPFPA